METTNVDDGMRRRIETLKESAERALRFMNATNSYPVNAEIAARGVRRETVLPQQAIPETFLGITVGYRTVTVGTQRDAQEALRAKIGGAVDDNGRLRGIVHACEDILASVVAPNDREIERMEDECKQLSASVASETGRRRELLEHSCRSLCPGPDGWRR